MNTKVQLVEQPKDFERFRDLIIEYEDDLPDDLKHSDLARELQDLHGVYGPPHAAFVASANGEAAGCVALRQLDPSTGVIRHLFVKPEHRGLGLARNLLSAAIGRARERGYSRVVLDTNSERLRAAYNLYLSIGFEACEPYAQVDYACPTFMQLRLTPAIHTPRLTGLPATADDLPYVVQTDSDARIQRMLFGKTHTRIESKDRLRRWLEHWTDHGFGFWVFRNKQGHQVGHAGLFHSPRRSGCIEVGYILKPKYWNKGYATEMTQAVLKVGFEDLHMSRIIAIALASNTASRHVLEKCGLRLVEEYSDPNDGAACVLYDISAPPTNG